MGEPACSIDTSRDLISLVKTKRKETSVCEVVKEHNDQKIVLTLCLGFGRKQKYDVLADSVDFIEEENSTFLLQCESPKHTVLHPLHLIARNLLS